MLASDNALNPRSLAVFSLTISLREPKSDVSKPVSSPTYTEQTQENEEVCSLLSVYTQQMNQNKL